MDKAGWPCEAADQSSFLPGSRGRWRKHTQLNPSPSIVMFQSNARYITCQSQYNCIKTFLSDRGFTEEKKNYKCISTWFPFPMTAISTLLGLTPNYTKPLKKDKFRFSSPAPNCLVDHYFMGWVVLLPALTCFTMTFPLLWSAFTSTVYGKQEISF